MNNNAEILLRDGRFFRRSYIEHDLGAQEQILERLADSASIHLKGFMSYNDEPLHLMVNKQKIVLLSRMKKLPFTTYWSIDPADPKFLLTTFKQTRGSIKIEDTFTIPETWGQLYFAEQFRREDSWPECCYLFLYREGELHWFPYPNLFDNGKICMGDDWDHKPTLYKDMITDFIHAHTTFHQTQMNDHLTSENTRALFRRSLDGWAPPADVTPYFRKVGNALMMGFNP